ncbi:MAG TPA: methyltransferase domain-containing protein [Chthoniobacteraceae bacterium]|nr:methyltransferase domain-containing protein [Chthoniobacteraceae bacterium]
MEKPSLNLKELKKLYAQQVNIMGLFREVSGSTQNTTDAILISYDLQSGSYVKAFAEPEHRRKHDLYAAEIAAVIEPLGAASLLEAGVGEATTLCSALAKMKVRPAAIAGFDISWSRISCARKFARGFGFDDANFFTGDLFHIPITDGTFDVVYTAHAIEPNHGREREILAELCRVARRWVVLFEPSFELGNAATRQRIEEHGYCRGLPGVARELGCEIVEHRLLANVMRENNQTAVLLIRKPEPAGPAPREVFACPICRAALELVRGHYFCDECSRVFPVIDGIPCLLAGNGILASKFRDA